MLKSAKAVIASRAALQQTMVTSLTDGTLQGRSGTHTTTALKRWSCHNKDLPSQTDIKAIHVYDFDNTLFSSPLPNPQLWAGPTIGFLQSLECFTNGGWWHDARILQATGGGMEVEEPLGWKGWWNEQIVKLVDMSVNQKDAITVLLTGRGETNFSSTIKRIVASRNLHFDLICLKPEIGPNNQRFPSTMKFKQAFLEDLVLTYKQADEIRVYEDRVGHVRGFREFFEKFNKELLATSSQSRKPILTEVIQVAEGSTYLDPVVEASEVQHMINNHNLSLQNASMNNPKPSLSRLQIKRTFLYTGYLLSGADSSRLIDQLLLPQLAPGLAESQDFKLMANNILITPRPASKSILNKVGGLGNKMRWQVTGLASHGNKLWAARVAPVPEGSTFHSENPVPTVLLGLRKGARPIDVNLIQNWQPVPPEKALIFDSAVGEKVLLRIDEEDANEGQWESLFANKNPNKRKHPYQQSREDGAYNRPRDNRDSGGYQGANNYDHPPHGRQQNYHNQQRHNGDGGRYHNTHNEDVPRRGGGPNYRGRGRGRGNRGGDRGRGGGRGRGRGGRDGGNPGGPSGYRSLDDYGAGGFDGASDDRGGGGSGGGAGPVMNY
ncbi:hypothetical protein FQN54_002573 [Arachnomyces sp. PD_36]|nr:hypothetical protein FQN54_002573 [Arachnomyces sp. PD_36]